MAFMATYMELRRLFPEVDDRLLKAAAIEHPNGIDFAIDFIFTEVLSDAPSGRGDAVSGGMGCFSTGDSTSSGVLQRSPSSNSYTSAVETEDFSTKVEPRDSLSSSGNIGAHVRLQEDFPNLSSASKSHVDIDSDEDSLTNSRFVSEDNISASDIGHQDPLKGLDGSINLAFDENLLINSQESLGTSTVDQTKQNFNVDFLEELVNEAGKNKPILMKAMESLFHSMKEAEAHEQEAEFKKLEAAVAGADALHKVEDLKNMLERAKVANDMRAGEVYGEKSILATEARELQGSLFQLAEKRDRHLSMIEEMKKDLQARIATADAIKAAAEQEKFAKESAAAKALAEQEMIMEKVVAESKKLQQQAEENSKLHESLIHRGRTVDILQGEISLICEDVKLLKERFDEGLSASSSTFMFSKLCRSRGSVASSLHSSTSQESLTSHGGGLQPHRSVASKRTSPMEPATLDEYKQVGETPADKIVDGDESASDDQWEDLLKDGPDSLREFA